MGSSLGERRWAGGRRDRNSLEAGGLTSSRHGDPPWRAQAALAARNDELLAELSAAIGLATAARLPRTDRQWALDRLAGFCSRRAPAYLAACDRAVYTLAAEAADTRLLVHALRVQRELIAAHVAELGSATEPTKIATAAHTVLAMLAACGEVERAVLWPALARLPGLDLAGAVAEFDALLRHCIPVELDVRKIPHGKRHSRILDICTRLAPGHSFVFIDNLDPHLLRLAIKASYPDRFDWRCLESGPSRWRVRITRVPAVPAGDSPRRVRPEGCAP